MYSICIYKISSYIWTYSLTLKANKYSSLCLKLHCKFTELKEIWAFKSMFTSRATQSHHHRGAEKQIINFKCHFSSNQSKKLRNTTHYNMIQRKKLNQRLMIYGRLITTLLCYNFLRDQYLNDFKCMTLTVILLKCSPIFVFKTCQSVWQRSQVCNFEI